MSVACIHTAVQNIRLREARVLVPAARRLTVYCIYRARALEAPYHF